MMCFPRSDGTALLRQISRIELRPGLAALWSQTVDIASVSLGVPDVVLHASAEWMRVGYGHVVATALPLIKALTFC